VQGLFGNTDCAAEGAPGPAELKLLQPWRAQLPATVFGPAYLSPRTDGEHSLRANLRQAQALLREAGWEVKDGALRNAQGASFNIEYLDSAETGARVVAPWVRNLEKLGIELKYRPVDFALYQERLRTFNFDITSIAYGGTHNPGPEYADLFGSKAADTEDSSNLIGVKSPAVDALIARMVDAETRPDFLAACRSLERVITHGHYLVPQWSSSTHRMVYNAKRLSRPEKMPPYAAGEDWAIDTWWSRTGAP
jgi:microcin C transport system substrate-binding protein